MRLFIVVSSRRSEDGPPDPQAFATLADTEETACDLVFFRRGGAITCAAPVSDTLRDLLALSPGEVREL